MFSKNKGITLIALVITIIVLLILAGISITSIVGDNGILGKSNDAKEETRGATVEERRDLWKLEKSANQYSTDSKEKTLEELLDELESEKLLKENERKEIEQKGHVIIGSRNISFSDGIIDKSYTVVSSENDVVFKNTITEGDIAVEKSGFTTYSIEGISISKDGPFSTTESVAGKTGNLEIIGDIQNTTFKYTLTNFMQGDEVFYVKVNIDGEEFFQELKIIQGDEVEYQDDFVGIQYLSYDPTNIVWKNVENEIFRDGKAKYVETTTAGATLEFTYLGSKFEIISRCNGYIHIEVANDKENVVNFYRNMDVSDEELFEVEEMNLVRDLTDKLTTDLYDVYIFQAKEIIIPSTGQRAYGINMYIDSIVIYK